MRAWVLCAVVSIATSAAADTTIVRVTQERRWGLFSAGLVVFTAAWAADLGASYALDNPDAAHALIPIVGPLVQMSDNWGIKPPAPTGNPQIDTMVKTRAAEVNDSIQTAAYVVLGIDFALQTTGLVMAIVGAASKRTTLQYEKSPPPMGVSVVRWQLTGNGVLLHF
jgi:hypothetical protein